MAKVIQGSHGAVPPGESIQLFLRAPTTVTHFVALSLVSEFGDVHARVYRDISQNPPDGAVPNDPIEPVWMFLVNDTLGEAVKDYRIDLASETPLYDAGIIQMPGEVLVLSGECIAGADYVFEVLNASNGVQGIDMAAKWGD